MQYLLYISKDGIANLLHLAIPQGPLTYCSAMVETPWGWAYHRAGHYCYVPVRRTFFPSRNLPSGSLLGSNPTCPRKSGHRGHLCIINKSFLAGVVRRRNLARHHWVGSDTSFSHNCQADGVSVWINNMPWGCGVRISTVPRVSALEPDAFS